MFAVVIVNSFEADCPMVMFTTRREARAYLQYAWEKAFNTELAESEVGLDESECFREDEYAKITWNDKDIMEFFVTFDSRPDAEFEEVKERYMKESRYE